MIFPFDKCGGCRTCEIACSFKFNGVFNHFLSAMQVVEQSDGYSLLFSEGELPGGFVCDGCKGLDTPMCVEYCNDQEELKEIIQSFLDRKDNDKKKEECPGE
jgi:Fe-S-cluster-containing hydrogenase component 2